MLIYWIEQNLCLNQIRLRKKSATKCGVSTHQCNNVAPERVWVYPQDTCLAEWHFDGKAPMNLSQPFWRDWPRVMTMTNGWMIQSSTRLRARQRANACRTVRPRPSRRLMCYPICRPFYRVTVGIWPLLRLRNKPYMIFSTDREEAPPNRRVCCIGQHPLGYGLQGWF